MSNVKNQKSDSKEEFTLEEEALIRQWLEYKKVVLDRFNPQSVLPHVIFQVLINIPVL